MGRRMGHGDAELFPGSPDQRICCSRPVRPLTVSPLPAVIVAGVVAHKDPSPSKATRTLFAPVLPCVLSDDGDQGAEEVYARGGRPGAWRALPFCTSPETRLTLHTLYSTIRRIAWCVAPKSSCGPAVLTRTIVDHHRLEGVRCDALPQPPSRRYLRLHGRGHS